MKPNDRVRARNLSAPELNFLLLAALLATLAAAGCSSAGSRPVAEGSPPAAAAEAPRAVVAKIAARVRRADYEGNRAELSKLFEEMAPYTQGALASRARYWRGFAMWRRALNGFSDGVDPAELTADLEHAIEEFDAASVADPRFVDAKIGAASCWSTLAFSKDGPERMHGFAKHDELIGEALKAEPSNPRLAWVLGANQLNTPPELGGGPLKAIATYEAGLASARRERVTDELNPSWGEPELLVNLAFVNLNLPVPDLAAALRYAEASLKLVPYWHYVSDLLIPQIKAAQKGTSGALPAAPPDGSRIPSHFEQLEEGKGAN